MKLSYLARTIAIATGSMLPTTMAVDRVLNAFGQESYGVDVSFPVHYLNVLNKEDNPLGNRQSFYEEFMSGCREHYGEKLGSTSCDITEEDRADMSLRQPASMQVSRYTLNKVTCTTLHLRPTYALPHRTLFIIILVLQRTTPILASRKSKHLSKYSIC